MILIIFQLLELKHGTRLANKKESKEILNGFEKRTEEIKNEKFIIEEYRKFARKNLATYLKICKGNKFIDKVLNKLFPNYLEKRYDKKCYLALLNTIRCEAHRELFITGIEDILNDEKSKIRKEID